MKMKHYNIIPHHFLFHTKVTNFNHFFQMKKKLRSEIFFQDVHMYFNKKIQVWLKMHLKFHYFIYLNNNDG
jgi:hypothetical protein